MFQTNRSRWFLAGAAVLALVVLLGLGHMRRGPMMMGGHMRGDMMNQHMRGGMMNGRAMMMGGRGWQPFAHMGGSLLLLGGLGVLAYLFVQRSYAPAATAPLEVLKLRLARGEITADEFDTLKGKLQQ